MPLLHSPPTHLNEKIFSFQISKNIHGHCVLSIDRELTGRCFWTYNNKYHHIVKEMMMMMVDGNPLPLKYTLY